MGNLTTVSTTIDWIRYSGPNPQYLKSMLPEILEPFKVKIKPLPYYTHAVNVEPAGRLDYNMLDASQGALVTFTGADLRTIEACGIDKACIVEYVVQNANLRATRLDLACDVVGVENAPDDVFSAWKDGKVKTRARGIEQYHGYCKQMNRSGNTVYIGSREGEQYLRVYDKGAQKKQNDLLWSRIELELKGDKAQIGARAVVGAGLNTAFPSALYKYFDCPDLEWWQEVKSLLPDADRAIMTGENHTKNSRVWLLGQALPAVIKAIRASDYEVIDIVDKELKKWDNWSI